jgi:hypothetical protein
MFFHFNFRTFFLRLFKSLTFRTKPDKIENLEEDKLVKAEEGEEGYFLEKNIER